jgi:hypothetical protein
MVIVSYLVCLYALAGMAVAVAFVALAADRVFAQHVSITWGARLLLIPGAAILWPWIVARWARVPR